MENTVRVFHLFHVKIWTKYHSDKRQYLVIAMELERKNLCDGLVKMPSKSPDLGLVETRVQPDQGPLFHVSHLHFYLHYRLMSFIFYRFFPPVI